MPAKKPTKINQNNSSIVYSSDASINFENHLKTFNESIDYMLSLYNKYTMDSDRLKRFKSRLFADSTNINLDFNVADFKDFLAKKVSINNDYASDVIDKVFEELPSPLLLKYYEQLSIKVPAIDSASGLPRGFHINFNLNEMSSLDDNTEKELTKEVLSSYIAVKISDFLLENSARLVTDADNYEYYNSSFLSADFTGFNNKKLLKDITAAQVDPDFIKICDLSTEEKINFLLDQKNDYVYSLNSFEDNGLNFSYQVFVTDKSLDASALDMFGTSDATVPKVLQVFSLNDILSEEEVKDIYNKKTINKKDFLEIIENKLGFSSLPNVVKPQMAIIETAEFSVKNYKNEEVSKEKDVFLSKIKSSPQTYHHHYANSINQKIYENNRDILAYIILFSKMNSLSDLENLNYLGHAPRFIKINKALKVLKDVVVEKFGSPKDLNDFSEKLGMLLSENNKLLGDIGLNKKNLLTYVDNRKPAFYNSITSDKNPVYKYKFFDDKDAPSDKFHLAWSSFGLLNLMQSAVYYNKNSLSDTDSDLLEIKSNIEALDKKSLDFISSVLKNASSKYDLGLSYYNDFYDNLRLKMFSNELYEIIADSGLSKFYKPVNNISKNKEWSESLNAINLTKRVYAEDYSVYPIERAQLTDAVNWLYSFQDMKKPVSKSYQNNFLLSVKSKDIDYLGNELREIIDKSEKALNDIRLKYSEFNFNEKCFDVLSSFEFSIADHLAFKLEEFCILSRSKDLSFLPKSSFSKISSIFNDVGYVLDNSSVSKEVINNTNKYIDLMAKSEEMNKEWRSFFDTIDSSISFKTVKDLDSDVVFKEINKMNPPEELVGKTAEWMLKMDAFTSVNNKYNSKLDANTSLKDLISSLAKLIDVSNNITNQSKKSGFLSAFKKAENNNADLLAEAFIDFQQKMVVFRADTTNQIEKDRSILGFASDLISSYDNCNNSWNNWISDNKNKSEKLTTSKIAMDVELAKSLADKSEVASIVKSAMSESMISSSIMINDFERVLKQKSLLMDKLSAFNWSALGAFAGAIHIGKIISIANAQQGLNESGKALSSIVAESSGNTSAMIDLKSEFSEIAKNQEAMEQFSKILSDMQNGILNINLKSNAKSSNSDDEYELDFLGFEVRAAKRNNKKSSSISDDRTSSTGSKP